MTIFISNIQRCVFGVQINFLLLCKVSAKSLVQNLCIKVREEDSNRFSMPFTSQLTETSSQADEIVNRLKSKARS